MNNVQIRREKRKIGEEKDGEKTRSLRRDSSSCSTTLHLSPNEGRHPRSQGTQLLQESILDLVKVGGFREKVF